MSNKEFIATREKLNQQTHITLPQTTKQYSAEEFSKKVNNIIHKFGLQIIGDKPTDKQVEFMIKTRSVLDECGIGLSKGLKYSDEYKELLKKFGEQVPTIDNKTPDWILFCLTIPSGINSAYLLWSYLPRNLKRQFFPNLPTLSKFKEQRELGIKELIQYANSSIEGSNQRLFDTNVS